MRARTGAAFGGHGQRCVGVNEAHARSRGGIGRGRRHLLGSGLAQRHQVLPVRAIALRNNNIYYY
jgi:hypothetical protein